MKFLPTKTVFQLYYSVLSYYNNKTKIFLKQMKNEKLSLCLWFYSPLDLGRFFSFVTL
jgi:hypothetical protein